MTEDGHPAAITFLALTRGWAELLADQRCNLGTVFFEGEVTCLQQVQTRLRDVTKERLGSCFGKEGIVLAPGDQRRWLVCSQIGLPRGVQRGICFVVVEHRELNLVISWSVEEILIVNP